MRLQLRRMGLWAATLVVAAAALGAGPGKAAGRGENQSAPATESSTPPAAKTRELTPEQRADVYMARKSYEDASDYYYRALKQKSFKDATLWNKLGISFQQVGKFALAGKAYIRAIHVNKDFPEAWNNLGTVYFMEKRYGKSVKYYHRAIELEPDTAPFHMNLGTSYYHLKRFDEAVAEYRTALRIDPNVGKKQSLLGTVVHASGTGPDFYYYMAKAFASVGDAEDAVRYLRHALEEGFGDAKQIGSDPDFQKISQDPAFVELLRNPPVAIKE